jgi:hypothetical protein
MNPFELVNMHLSKIENQLRTEKINSEIDPLIHDTGD